MKTYEVKKDIVVTSQGLVDADGELLGGIIKAGATVCGDPESKPVKKWVDKECIKEQSAVRGFATTAANKVKPKGK